MKKLIISTLIVVLAQLSFGQTNSFSCEAHDSVIEKYKNDADQLALRRIIRNNLPYADSVFIPSEYSDTVLNALVAVYNAISIPSRDTIISKFDIHAFPLQAMNTVVIEANSNLEWMNQLSANNIPTGHPAIDSILISYNLKVEKYNIYPEGINATVFLHSDINYNMIALAAILDTITDVENVFADGWVGMSKNIEDSIYGDHIELIYSYRWEEYRCGNKCRNWKFNVSFDCSVEFVESYGDVITSTKEIAIPEITISPNPFNNFININGTNSGFEYSIFNNYGQRIKQGFASENRIGNLDKLSSGYYFLHLKTNKTESVFKLVK